MAGKYIAAPIIEYIFGLVAAKLGVDAATTRRVVNGGSSGDSITDRLIHQWFNNFSKRFEGPGANEPPSDTPWDTRTPYQRQRDADRERDEKRPAFRLFPGEMESDDRMPGHWNPPPLIIENPHRSGGATGGGGGDPDNPWDREWWEREEARRRREQEDADRRAKKKADDEEIARRNRDEGWTPEDEDLLREAMAEHSSEIDEVIGEIPPEGTPLGDLVSAAERARFDVPEVLTPANARAAIPGLAKWLFFAGGVALAGFALLHQVLTKTAETIRDVKDVVKEIEEPIDDPTIDDPQIGLPTGDDTMLIQNPGGRGTKRKSPSETYDPDRDEERLEDIVTDTLRRDGVLPISGSDSAGYKYKGVRDALTGLIHRFTPGQPLDQVIQSVYIEASKYQTSPTGIIIKGPPATDRYNPDSGRPAPAPPTDSEQPSTTTETIDLPDGGTEEIVRETHKLPGGGTESSTARAHQNAPLRPPVTTPVTPAPPPRAGNPPGTVVDPDLGTGRWIPRRPPGTVPVDPPAYDQGGPDDPNAGGAGGVSGAGGYQDANGEWRPVGGEQYQEPVPEPARYQGPLPYTTPGPAPPPPARPEVVTFDPNNPYNTSGTSNYTIAPEGGVDVINWHNPLHAAGRVAYDYFD